MGSGASDSNGDSDSGGGGSGDDDSNSNSGGGDSNSGEKNNSQLKVAVKKAATMAAAEVSSVLELLRMGTYIKYPYLEFHEYRARVLLLVLSQS